MYNIIYNTSVNIKQHEYILYKTNKFMIYLQKRISGLIIAAEINIGY